MKIISKLIVISLSVLLVTLSMLSIEEVGFCRYFFGLETGCVLNVNGIYEICLFSLTAVALPALITIPFRSIVFKRWSQFATFAIPLVSVLVIWLAYSDSQSGGGFMSISVAPFLIGSVLFFYYIISFVVLFHAWRADKNGDTFSLTRSIVVGMVTCVIMILLFIGWIFLANLD